MEGDMLEIGKSLLEDLHLATTPLHEDQIKMIVYYLDWVACHEPSTAGSSLPYRARDLQIGTKVQREQTMSGQPFNNTHDNAQAEHFDPVIQAAAFEFIKSDVRVELGLQKPQNWIIIRGVRRTFFHHQLYAAFWLLCQERGSRRGAILADLMGMGKTTTAFLYILLNYFVTENAIDIRENPGRHCQPDQDDTQATRRCPSHYLWPVRCACEAQSVTRRLKLVPIVGASLLLCPASLLGRWKSEWQALGCDESIKLRLFIHHQAFPGEEVPQKWTKHIALHLRTDSEGTSGPKQNLFAPSSRFAHWFMVMTSVESYYSRVQIQLGRRYQWQVSPDASNGNAGNADYTDGLAWARVLRDEAHLTPNWETTVYKILMSLINNAWTPPNFLALTATPMLRNGAGDIVACIKIINRLSPALALDSQYAQFLKDDYLKALADRSNAYGHQWIKQGGKAKDSDSSLGEDVGELLAAYTIRRHSSSMQNGRALASIPPLEWYDVQCASDVNIKAQLAAMEKLLKKHVNDEWLDQMQQWLQRSDVSSIQSEVECKIALLLQNAKVARILATVPGLTRYGDQKILRWATIRLNDWHLVPNKSPFYVDLDQLVQSSGKLRMLADFLGRLDSCLDARGRPEHLVIISEFPVICLIALCLCRRLGFTSEWIHAEVNVIDREDLCLAFQESDVGVSPTTARATFRILIGTSKIIGQGFTLTRAHRLVLMEPSIHAEVEAQNADRVHRIGSRADRCSCYRLMNPDSALEQLLVVGQDGQRRLRYAAEWLQSIRD